MASAELPPTYVVGMIIAVLLVFAAGSAAVARREELQWRRLGHASGPGAAFWTIVCIGVFVVLVALALLGR